MKSFLLLIFFTIVSLSPFAQTADLTINVTNIQYLEGRVMIALFNSEESYLDLDKMYAGYDIAADSSVVSCSFQSLPAGIYALTIYHDEDSNGELNRNWLGMPQEGYAFSNNYFNVLKPASYKDAAFEVTGNALLSIKMNY